MAIIEDSNSSFESNNSAVSDKKQIFGSSSSKGPFSNHVGESVKVIKLGKALEERTSNESLPENTKQAKQDPTTVVFKIKLGREPLINSTSKNVEELEVSVELKGDEHQLQL